MNNCLLPCLELLRWDKPSGRLILLIPAGWSLWLSPSAPPPATLLIQIILGGLSISGAGCIANDLWDRNFDSQVHRTRNRPLAKGTLKPPEAFAILILMLTISLGVIFTLPKSSFYLCLSLASSAVVPILLYPSAKRWFTLPQLFLAICWGYAVLIPWAAAESQLRFDPVLISCWLAVVIWSFGFDTVYAMADRHDDVALGIHSSAISLGSSNVFSVRICYSLTSILIAISAFYAGIGTIFWPFWVISSVLMQLACVPIKNPNAPTSVYSKHFKRQVQLGLIILIGIILARGY